MKRYLPAIALAILLLGPAGTAAAQLTEGKNVIAVPLAWPPEAAGCAVTRRAASQTAAAVVARLKDGDAKTRREILLRLLMSQDAAAMFPCLPNSGAADSGSTATQNVFSERTREVGTDRLTRYELAQLFRTLEFIRAARVSSAADPDCIVHDDGSITCIKEDEWICWCDAPDTSGGECGCADF
jgi:hypothetical protein